MNTNLNLSFIDLENITGGYWINVNDKNTIISGITTDSRADSNGLMFLALKGEQFNGHNFIPDAIASGCSAICAEEPYQENIKKIANMPPTLFVKNTLLAYQEIARDHRQHLSNLKLIAITGSNGKTSTKEILSQILIGEYGSECVYATRANTNNHIGVPQNLLNLNEKHRFAVIELGSNHPGEIDLLASIALPDVAIITSIGQAHIEFFKTLDGVAQEKSSIFNYLKLNDKSHVAILPEKSLKYDIIKESLFKKTYYTFSEKSPNSYVNFELISASFTGTEFLLKWNATGGISKVSWNILGNHQISNASVAATCASIIGINHEKIATHMGQCHLSGMRMRPKEVNGIYVINDAYNANPSSVKAGLYWLKLVSSRLRMNNKCFIVLGDMLELGDNSVEEHISLMEYAINELPSSYVFVGVGETMQKSISKILEKNSYQNLFSCDNSEMVLPMINSLINSGDFIYLKGSRRMRLEKVEEAITSS